MKLSDIFKESLPLIEQYAPAVATAINAHLGLAATYIIPILTQAFGVPAGDIKGLATSIIKDTDAPTILRNIQSLHGDWLTELLQSANKLSKAQITVNLEWAN